MGDCAVRSQDRAPGHHHHAERGHPVKLAVGQKHVLNGGYEVDIIRMVRNPDYWGASTPGEPEFYYLGRFYFPDIDTEQFIWLLEDGCDWTEVAENTYSIKGNSHVTSPPIFPSYKGTNK
jgi:hypothetical protein